VYLKGDMYAIKHLIFQQQRLQGNSDEQYASARTRWPLLTMFGVLTCDRHFTIADGVQDVHIVGLSLVNGLAHDGLGIVAEGGGCVLMGQNASLSLLNVTFQNCHANYDGSMEPTSSGRGGAVFVGALSTLVVKDSVIRDCSSGRHGGGLYSDTHSHLEMLGVVFQSLAAGVCVDRPEVCISIDWIDEYGDDCDFYAANPMWCGGDSNVMCCACRPPPCEPTGGGGAYFAASDVSATISNSAFLDCSSNHGAAMMLSGAVSLFLQDVSMSRNYAHGNGGALNAANGGNTISIYGGSVIDNFAGWEGGGFYVFNSNIDATNLPVIGNNAYKGGGIYLDYATLTLSGSSILDNMADFGGGVAGERDSSVTLQGASACSGNTAVVEGGGLFLRLSSSLTALTSHINGNRASGVGGGMTVYESSVMLVDSSVSGNTASFVGGGGFLLSSALVAFSCLIDDNTAANGGGLFTVDSSLMLRQVQDPFCCQNLDVDDWSILENEDDDL